MKPSDAQIKIRVPAEVRQWLEAQCAYYGSSQASEVVRAIRERMDREARERTPPASQVG